MLPCEFVAQHPQNVTVVDSDELIESVCVCERERIHRTVPPPLAPSAACYTNRAWESYRRAPSSSCEARFTCQVIIAQLIIFVGISTEISSNTGNLEWMEGNHLQTTFSDGEWCFTESSRSPAFVA